MMKVTDIQGRNQFHRTLSTLVFVALSLAPILNLIADGRSADPLRSTAFTVIDRAPMLFCLWATWTIRLGFDSLARGVMFGQVVPMLLERVGLALALGAIVNEFLMPIVLRPLHGQGYGALVKFDPSAITLESSG